MKRTELRISLKGRIELYLLKIKIGHPFKSKIRIAIEELPSIFKNKKLGVLIG